MLPTTTSKVYAASINGSIKSNNSTCPLPPQQQQPAVKEATYQLSRDVTTLYELFSNTTNITTNQYNTDNLVCFCCEREITKRRIINSEEDRKRKLEEIATSTSTNKITSALYYGSNQVRKYMKKVMRRDNWNDILKHGFPCPHTTLFNNNNKRVSSHYFCTLCDTDQYQRTLRLTLTPSSCRAQDKEIYGEYQFLQQKTLDKVKKRRGKIY